VRLLEDVLTTAPPAEDAEHHELNLLWAKYKTEDDHPAKDELLLHYIKLVKRIVRRMMPKYNAHSEFDDLVNCGILGLIDAVEKFDLSQGVRFETYAVTRIRGEILDYMRAQDWAPSSARKKINAINEAYERLESTEGRPPTDESLAEAVNMPVANVQKLMDKNHLFNLVSFEDTLSAGLPALDLAGPEDQIPENLLLESEMRGILAEAIDALPEKEKLVVTLYYYEELLLRDIAKLLGVTESRISQIHSKALAKMRSRLQKII